MKITDPMRLNNDYWPIGLLMWFAVVFIVGMTIATVVFLTADIPQCTHYHHRCCHE